MPSGERELWVQKEIFLSVAMGRGEQIRVWGDIRLSGDMKRVSPEGAKFTLLLTPHPSGFNWPGSESRA